MTLTKEKEALLRARYAVWGLENVRQEMERSAHASLVPPDVAAFARMWIWEEDARRDRRAKLVRVSALLFLALLGGAVAAVLAA